ncbi:stress responsive A/B barrel domain-containing protein [Nemania serpens]|nr:stress responsive A/B barrel domain-containing protein [Nemania serpens]
MTVYHVLMLKFKDEVTPEEVKAACDEVLELPTKCLHPTTKTQYIKPLGGGKDHSIEGHQNGFTHCFISKFENEDDRKYYVEGDPAHLGIIKTLVPKLDKIQVLDFTPGEY